MSIGNIHEKDVVTTLAILLRKLTHKSSDTTISNIPEILVESIRDKLYDDVTLLILDDVRSPDIMKYFRFPNTYLVTSRNKNLLASDAALVSRDTDKHRDTQTDTLTYIHA